MSKDKYNFQRISFSTKELTVKNKKIAKGKVQLKGGEVFVKVPFLKFNHIIKVTRLINNFIGVSRGSVGNKIDLDVKEDVGF